MGRPPFVNAAVTNRFASVEEGSGIGAAKKPFTPGTRTDAKQGESFLHPIKL
jgi:hypothetical protein